jgi:hypothetical protein
MSRTLDHLPAAGLTKAEALQAMRGEMDVRNLRRDLANWRQSAMRGDPIAPAMVTNLSNELERRLGKRPPLPPVVPNIDVAELEREIDENTAAVLAALESLDSAGTDLDTDSGEAAAVPRFEAVTTSGVANLAQVPAVAASD